MGVRIAFPEMLGTINNVRLVQRVGIVVSVVIDIVGDGNDGLMLLTALLLALMMSVLLFMMLLLFNLCVGL